MSKYVTDTKAGKSISAYVILKKGVEVARVTAHFSDGGSVLVNVHNIGDKATEACVKASKTDLKGKRAYEVFGFQKGTAGGYGYDKFTAALSGLWIDGHIMHNHCGHSQKSERMLKQYRAAFQAAKPRTDDEEAKFRKLWNAKAEKIGASFANWSDGGYTSLFMRSGLNQLTSLGYTVIQAI